MSLPRLGYPRELGKRFLSWENPKRQCQAESGHWAYPYESPKDLTATQSVYWFGHAAVEPTAPATAFWQYQRRRPVAGVGYWAPLAGAARVG